jgi:hypothetical protein
LDARLVALQELLGMDRSRALREAINSDKRNDHVKLAKLAAMYRELKGKLSAGSKWRKVDVWRRCKLRCRCVAVGGDRRAACQDI